MTEQMIKVEGLPEGWRVKTMTIRPRHSKADKFKAEAILELERIKPLCFCKHCGVHKHD